MSTQCCRAPLVLALVASCSALGCAPYPDSGEFLAGVVYATNFMSGVKVNPTTGASPIATTIAQNDNRPGAYTVLTDRGDSAAQAAPSSPLWGSLWGQKASEPLDVASAQQVYVFDGACSSPEGYVFDDRQDLARLDRQYPVFQDIPELVTSSRPGRQGAANPYSALVEIIHIKMPAGFPCQSIKRFTTVTRRLDPVHDLKVIAQAEKEYRLLLIFDPAATFPPLPTQIGWFDQLAVPYIDMGPVPVIKRADGKSVFATMPLISFPQVRGAVPLLLGDPPTNDAERAAYAPYQYSPICRRYTSMAMSADYNIKLDAYKTLVEGAPSVKDAKGAGLTACLVCKTTWDGSYLCPFADSRAGAR